MNYSDTAELLNKSENVGKDFIVDLDEGRFTFSHEEALEAWDSLAPGEAFEIVRIGEYA